LLDYLEKVIPASGFLVEDRLTLADISIASPFATLGHAGTAIDGGRYPKLKAYVDAILARPSFAPLVEREKAFLGQAA
jgi:glutathione S-transferase